MSEEIRIARQWLAKAKNDLLNADNNLKADEVPYDTVCFHCQQAAEKLLKAYLVVYLVNSVTYFHAERAKSPDCFDSFFNIFDKFSRVNFHSKGFAIFS